MYHSTRSLDAQKWAARSVMASWLLSVSHAPACMGARAGCGRAGESSIGTSCEPLRASVLAARGLRRQVYERRLGGGPG